MSALLIVVALWLLHGALLLWWDRRHARVPPWMRWAFAKPWFSKAFQREGSHLPVGSTLIFGMFPGPEERWTVVGHSEGGSQVYAVQTIEQEMAAEVFFWVQKRLCGLLYLPFNLWHWLLYQRLNLALWLYDVAVEPFVRLGGWWTVKHEPYWVKVSKWLKRRYMTPSRPEGGPSDA